MSYKTNLLSELPKWNELDLASQLPSYDSFGRSAAYIQKSWGITNTLEFERMMTYFRERGYLNRSFFFLWKRSKTVERALKVEGYW